MKKRHRLLALVVTLAMGASPAWACSAFSAKMGAHQVVAKNFDWFSGEGFLVVNERGRQRTSFLEGGPRWSSRFGSVSLTILGPGLPVSGMNEKGLVVESLVNQDASVDSTSGQLASLEWVQFVLDQFETAQEVRVSLKEFQPRPMVIPLHFFICDRSGDCLVVEPDGDRLDVISGGSLRADVVANRPWKQDFRAARAHEDSFFKRVFTPGYRSHARFATISNALEESGSQFSKNDIRDLLEDARISSLNRWQIIWNQSEGKTSYRIRTKSKDGPFRQISFARTKFKCQSASRVLTLSPDKSVWRDYTREDSLLVKARLGEMIKVRRGAAQRSLPADVANYTLTSTCGSES